MMNARFRAATVPVAFAISAAIALFRPAICSATDLPPPTGSLAPRQLPSLPGDYFANSLIGSAFSTSSLLAVLARVAATSIPEVYIFPATQEGAKVLESGGIYKAVYLNKAAETVFGPPPPKESDDIVFLEIGINGLSELNTSFQNMGIREGFVDGKLFLILHPRYFHPQTCRTSGLLFEHWQLYVLSPSGKIAPTVETARRSSQAFECPATRSSATQSPVERGWFLQLYRAKDGLRVLRPLFKAE
jgi:hypothetical protein